ncbi:MAG TPA: ATP-binding protein [Phenylobacterium sp.]|nr:ATP-binding protein [Phenylobacterium sp.]HQN50285.1 ATP-binding protein [Phenylobacterium sp.]HQP19271.1 ATP-binding protein [Phenylobacterium sp.]
MTETGRDRPQAPIAVQLVILLVVSLVVAQLLVFAMLIITPPPARAIYWPDEIARALKGGDLATRAGRPLVRTVQEAPPADKAAPPLGAHGPGPRPDRAGQLADLLGAPAADVRLVEKPPMSPFMLGARFRDRFAERREPPPGDGPPRDMRRPGEGAGGFMGRGPEGPWRGHGPGGFAFGEGGRPLFGSFVAAARQADGRWVVVRPRPDPFPNDWQRALMLWLFATLLVIVPLGYLFARRITAPIGQFARAAERLGRDPSAPMMMLTGPAEIGQAAKAFNDMQARLKRYVEDRTAMMGAISHDLRTPLARIRFKMEAAPDTVKSAVVSDIEQMEQMITSVLAFIRYASASRPRERLDLLSLVEVLVDEAAEVGQDVTLTEGVAATVHADALGLQRLFRNLIDNAVKYGHRARVTLFREGDEAVVEVQDDGPGLSTGELERVFQAFYRAESARTLDGSGVGLGLAVARSLARAHGGDVSLRSGGKGLVAQVRLPLSRD